MNYYEWQDLHNDDFDDSQYDYTNVTDEIQLSDYVYYEFKARVTLLHGIPCDAEILEMRRLIVNYDGAGEVLDDLELRPNEYPYYITKAAINKIVQGWVK